jgi:outer membrane protein assembly factor BamD (BamD/ComL family)
MAVSQVATANPPAQRAAAKKPAFKAADLLANPKQRNMLLAGVGLILLAVAGAWLWNSAAKRKETFAARALQQARQVAESGNLPQAAADLQKVSQTYAGTRSAMEAMLVLNQVRMVNGQTELAVGGLRDFLAKNPPVAFQAPAWGLLGVALENQRKPAEAAEAFGKASAAAEVDYLRAEYLLQQGRALTNAGKTQDAIAAYRKIVKDFPETNAVTEAKVRLAELTKGAE